MKSIEQVIEAHEIEINCGVCRRISPRSIGWLRGRRDMDCPACGATIVLGTSPLNQRVRSVERQIRQMSQQLTAKRML